LNTKTFFPSATIYFFTVFEVFITTLGRRLALDPSQRLNRRAQGERAENDVKKFLALGVDSPNLINGKI